MEPNEIVTLVTERVKDAANVKVVFGDPVETAGGVTIIPVASVKVSGGGGGGKGRRQEGAEESTTSRDRGMGLGIKVTAKPLGYIEVKGNDARFVAITDMTKIALGGFFTGSLLLLTASRFMQFKQLMKLGKRQKMGWPIPHRGH